MRTPPQAGHAHRRGAARIAHPACCTLARLLTERVQRVGAARDALQTLLESAVLSTPWVSKFGMAADFGVGADGDPYVRACRAECMLAAFILHVERGSVSFVDEDRIEVLRDAPDASAVEAVRAAAALR